MTDITKANYIVKQDADGFFYSYTRDGIVEERVTDDGFNTMREAAYHLGYLIDIGSTPGGRVTLAAAAAAKQPQGGCCNPADAIRFGCTNPVKKVN